VSEEYDCQACGACCSTSPGELDYVLVRHGELDELLEHVPDYYVRTDQDGIHALRTCPTDQGLTTCVALEGEVGEEVSCTIYENRPRACRNFQAGSMACEMARSAIFGSDR
jgi:Fe-S-cluster containining protein